MVAMAACGSGGDANIPAIGSSVIVPSPTGSAAVAGGAGNTVPAPTAAPAPTQPPIPTTAASGPVTVAFGGDVHGEPPINGVLDAGANPLESVAPVLAAADIAAVNLETTIGTTGTKIDKKYNFRSDDRLLASIKAAGVDVVSLANNHSYDWGQDGFLETFDKVKAAGLLPAGAGRNAAEAWAPAVIDVRGTKVAIIGLAKVGPPDAGRAVGDRPGSTNGRDIPATVAAIQAAKAITPVVIVFVHWGIELDTCPSGEDRSLAQTMLDAGASAVIGAHPHVLQGFSTPPGGKFVAYSIGNFVFYAKRDAARRTGVLTVTFSPDGTVLSHVFDPAYIDGQGRPILLSGADRDAARAEQDRIRIRGPVCP